MADITKHAPSNLTAKKSSGSDIDAFVRRTRALQASNREQRQRGRVICEIDATASRQPTWDMATHLQAEMFEEVSSNLDVQLVYYRAGECRASGWFSSGDRLANLMTGIACQAGITQIGKVLAHARREAEAKPASEPTLVFIGDAMEENIDELAATAAELGRLGVKVFMFQEGSDAQVEYAFREVARLSGGAFCRFDANAPRQLAELLRAVAAFAVGGVEALQAKPGATKLLEQLSRTDEATKHGED